jgi:polygalacturonase/4-amino-4-deoxy-L-arabinose transferase-like glycosyltransferase
MKRKIFTVFLVLFILGINIFLGIPRMSQFSAVDEPYWTFQRTPKFWSSIKNHKWKGTNVNDKPGVTVAAISGVGLLRVDPLAYKSLRGDAKTPEQLQEIKNVNFYMRLPIFLFIVLMLPFFYLLLKEVFDERVAILGFIFIGLSPILFGMSLLINPDALLWVFAVGSILSYFAYQKSTRRKYLYLAGISLGFSLLTKYVANILYIYFFLLPFLEYIFLSKKPKLSKYLKKSAKDYGVVALLSLLIFFIFFPATWINPKLLLTGTFLSQAFKTTWPFFAGLIGLIAFDFFVFKSKATGWFLNKISEYRKYLIFLLIIIFLGCIFFVLLNTYLGMKFVDFEKIVASPKGSTVSVSIFIGKILADFYSLIFGINPLIFIGALFAFFAILFKKEKYDWESRLIFYFLLFILFYYFASTVNSVVATVRYQILLYPLFLIIGAIGIKKLLLLYKPIKEWHYVISYFLLIVVLLFSLFSIKPFYLTYASRLLPQKYILNLKDMGDGSFESANYLNKLPNAKDLLIWSDKGAVCESFIGQCVIGFTKKDLSGRIFDYFVVSSGRKSRTSKMGKGVSSIDFNGMYDRYPSDYEVNFDNRPENFVRVINGGYVYKNRATKMLLPENITKNFPKASLQTPFANDLEIIQPSFPDRICNIADYGAVEGGLIKNTEAVKNAIDDCSGKGGGEVSIPNGVWLTGAIHLKDNINLNLNDNAELLFSQDPNDYLPVVFSRYEGIEYYNYSPLIYANGKINIAITGKGKLNCQGRSWWTLDWEKGIKNIYAMGNENVPISKRVFGTREAGLRPAFIEFINCNVGLIEDVNILEGPMWTIHPTYSENMTIRRVNVKTDPGPSTDGIAIDSSKNVLVENSIFSTGDDAIVLKSGRNNDGLRVNWPTENVVIRNCIVNETHGGTAIGSEMSGGVRNVLIDGLSVNNSQNGVRIKTDPTRGGFVENIWVNNFKVHNAQFNAFGIESNYDGNNTPPENMSHALPKIDNINVGNFSCGKSKYAVYIDGFSGSKVKNINFSNISINSGHGVFIENADGVEFKNADIKTKYEPLFDIKNSENVVY